MDPWKELHPGRVITLDVIEDQVDDLTVSIVHPWS